MFLLKALNQIFIFEELIDITLRNNLREVDPAHDSVGILLFC